MNDPEQDAFYRALGSRVKELRSSRISQEQLAKAVGLSRTSIVNIECGRQKVLLHNLFEISRALGVQPADLIVPLQSARSELPDLSAAGDAADWIQRSLERAGRFTISP